MPDLLPCPFCKKYGVYHVQKHFDGIVTVCNWCRATGPLKRGGADTSEAADALWNTRANQDETRDE